MKTELMRELFMSCLNENHAYTGDFIEGAEFGFQAACNMFLPFVKIVKDSNKVKEGDLVYKFYSKKEGGGSNHWQVVADPLRDSECSIESAESLVKVDGFNIIRNGKYAIRESELIKQGEK